MIQVNTAKWNYTYTELFFLSGFFGRVMGLMCLLGVSLLSVIFFCLFL